MYNETCDRNSVDLHKFYEVGQNKDNGEFLFICIEGSTGKLYIF